MLALLAGLAWLPIRQSVLAPAEVIPKQPVLIRAPIDGVVDRTSGPIAVPVREAASGLVADRG